MEEIKVGEFIRTKTGTIWKIKRIDFDKIDKSLKWYIYDKKDYITGIVGERAINKPYIKVHSFNIIDLIEEGDFVNGIRVEYVYRPEGTYVKYIVINENHLIGSNDDIKSIVTKEQMKTIEYEVS